MKSAPMFVTCDTPTPAARPVLLNKPTSFKPSVNTQGHPTMTTIKHVWNDASILRELAGKKANEAVFSLNTNSPQDAAKSLRDALGYVERLLASAAPGITGNGVDEFANYDLNANFCDPDAVTGNAGQPDEFSDYDINKL